MHDFTPSAPSNTNLTTGIAAGRTSTDEILTVHEVAEIIPLQAVIGLQSDPEARSSAIRASHSTHQVAVWTAIQEVILSSRGSIDRRPAAPRLRRD
jgi:hypothetical protein